MICESTSVRRQEREERKRKRDSTFQPSLSKSYIFNLKKRQREVGVRVLSIKG